MKLAGWGNYPKAETRLVRCRYLDEAVRLLEGAGSIIARGNGRSYGDAGINPERTLSMLGMDRIRKFDPETGRITCEAGLLLGDLLELMIPRGWFVPVAPGTGWVTIGGMAAADVHGKNHHRAGPFSRHIEQIELLTGDANVIVLDPENEPEKFWATCGGMGLTGIILTVTFRMKRIETGLIREETLPAANLEETMMQFETSADWTHSVAWVDCLASGRNRGRALVFRGEHVRRNELSLAADENPLAMRRRRTFRIPFNAPSVLLNRLSVGAFNTLFYRRGVRLAGARVVDLAGYFFPLDSVRDWNRLYGRKGFAQHQCVLPKEAAAEGIALILHRTARAGQGSLLAVLKLLGPETGPLSFPMQGYTLALDFPVRADSLSLMNELDAIVRDHGGRLYLAKDSRAAPETLASGYPRLEAFRQIRRAMQGDRFQSLLSKRLELG